MFHVHSVGDILENPAAVAVGGFLLIALYQAVRRLRQRAREESGADRPGKAPPTARAAGPDDLPDADAILARGRRRECWLGAAHAVLLGLLLGGGYLGWKAWRDTTLSATELAQRISAEAGLPVTLAANTAGAFKVGKVVAQKDDLRFMLHPLHVPADLSTYERMAWASDIGYGEVCRLLEPYRREGITPRLQVSREVYDRRGELMASTQGDIGACIAYTGAGTR